MPPSVPTPADFLQFSQWAGILTLVCGAIAALGFLLKWGIRFRFVGVTGFMGVLTVGLFALSLVPITRTVVPGALRFSTVYDSGATQVVITVPTPLTEEALRATLQQAASDFFSPGRLGRTGEKLTIRARTIVHPQEGLSQPLYLGQIKRSLLERDDDSMELTINRDQLAQLPPPPPSSPAYALVTFISFSTLSMASSTPLSASAPPLVSMMAPTQVMRGADALAQSGEAIARFGKRPLIVGGDRTLKVVRPFLKPVLKQQGLHAIEVSYGPDCSESSLSRMGQAVQEHEANFVIGVGGGKALDAAKLLAYQCQLPVVTIPTAGATCAAWTALSNVYSDAGAFLYDVALPRCPDLLILDYGLVETSDRRTLVAGIGDALAKWYESSVSSGHSEQTLIIAAVQQARVLRDLLFQKAIAALETPGRSDWREVVDATVLLAGVIGGLGGAQCRTVAAHAVHNGLTHLPQSHGVLHGEKVAYGILVQLRLEEMVQGNRLASTARQQLIQFYDAIGLPQTLADLGLGDIRLTDLQTAAEVACRPGSDIHRLPFPVTPAQVMAAMVSTTVPGLDMGSREAMNAGQEAMNVTEEKNE